MSIARRAILPGLVLIALVAAFAMPAGDSPRLDGCQVTPRGVPEDFIFAPGYTWLHERAPERHALLRADVQPNDRIDVPWQAPREEDPDDLRSF